MDHNKLWKILKEMKSVVHSDTAAAAKSLQSCLTLWDPIDGSPPGSPIPGIHQAKTLEWVEMALGFSKNHLVACPRTGEPSPRDFVIIDFPVSLA